MIRRWIAFACCAVVGGAVGWWAGSREGLAWGLLLGAAGWQLMDSFYARRLLNWLRSEQSNETPVLMAGAQPRLPGVWGEAADRVRRLLKNRHQQYSESQARLDEFLSALQASPNGVVLLDDEGRIEWCNQMAAQHFGFDAKRDIQQHIANLVRDPAFNAYMATANFSQEVVIPGNFSTPARPVKLSVHVHCYGKGKKLLLSRDITALEQAEAMRRDFVANVSHEIRTPLTVVSGFIETLQTFPLKKPERDRYLCLMAQQSQRMQTLVDDLLTLSRLEGSPLPGAQEWSATKSLFAQCEQEARALSGVIAPQGHQLVFEPGPACEIAGIQREICSALSNLVTNAVRYTPEAGLIRVSWTLLADGRGEFRVRDSGPGIAPEHLPRLTERFYRVDRSRSRETGGTGLGLAIVKHVAQRHGAQLRIESQVGQGSCFSIIFPAARVRQPVQAA
ncbi:phosphate regulon sensor histidine kinase PhoR [Polaromonas naphthalenivorans]|uniref:Phosphate regulon sensor protein PhoR n=1 Tax=Polaromonas naphthalenivorans (strain CJ2) TaxID=365044 RepID=A1VPD0_POLNA|nr:phosphate regulon sensor histidine kinase PhoR [Polaromonas naphthalenivorans]ABM37508.1 multi-sensor signal transduction histidine kinase [Polaromonas naphthalenivorans CJ2]